MHYRLLLSLLCGLLITVSHTTLANTTKLAGTKLSFEHYKISTPFKVSLPVIAVDIISNAQYPADELVLIGNDEQNETWLAVYVLDAQKNDFVLFDKLPLPKQYFAFDVSENKQGLYFLAKNEVASLHYNDDLRQNDKATSGLFIQQKQMISSIFLQDKPSFVAQKDFIQDVNKDGLDDIILPDFEHTNLWLAVKDNQDYFYQHLPIKTRVELNRSGVSFNPLTLFLADLNLDGQQDIAWVSKGQINYFSQQAQGKFSAEQNTLDINNEIDGLNWWQIRESDGENLDQSELSHRVIEEIKDINGDGLVDLGVRFTKSSGVFDRVNDYEFYLGFTNENGQLEFPKVANTVIKAEGTLTGLKIVDVNNDGKFEVLLSSFELSISNIIGVLLSGGIDQNVLLFALNDNDIYSSDSIIDKEVELSFSLTSGQSGEAIVLLTDVNGDELQDLVLSSGEEKLNIFLGQKSARLFNRKASKHKLQLPKDGALFEHYDINHDGKQDFIMRYGRLDDESMANQVTILMVK